MSLGLSALGFILAVLPRTDAGGFRNSTAPPPWPALKLLRAPIVWLGLVLLAYITIQGINPAWRFAINADSWWLEEAAHLSWLPSGVDAPFDRSNPWRALAVFGSLWLLACSVAIGFQRRKSYLALFIILAGNAALLALLGVLQRLSATQQIFWFYEPSNHLFISSFIYPNHGGPYFNLMVALSAGLALRAFGRTQQGVHQPARAAFFVFCAVSAGMTVVLSYSRMSVALLIAFMALLRACPRTTLPASSGIPPIPGGPPSSPSRGARLPAPPA